MASRNEKTLRVGALPTSEVDADRATRAFDPLLRVGDILDRYFGDHQSHPSHSSFHSVLFGYKSDAAPANISHFMNKIILQNEFFLALM
jgi:hypothetical protein